MDPEEDAAGPAPDTGESGAGGNKGVLLAVAVLLLWTAGACLFVAFEGSGFLPDTLPTGPGGKPSYFLGIIQAVTRQAQQLQQQGQAQQDSGNSGSSGSGG